MEYPHNSAGRLLKKDFASAKPTEKVGEILNRMKSEIEAGKTIDYVYILDKDQKLTGVVSIKELFVSSKSTQIQKLIKREPIFVSPETDKEQVADIAVKHTFKAVPVVDAERKMVGIVPIEAILMTLNKALREDVLHFAGIHKSHLKYENTLAVPVFTTIVHRLPWLLLGLAGIIFTAFFIGKFESVLQRNVILAFFIPAVLYMSNALSTQHQTLLIRDLALLGKELKIYKYFSRQLIISLIIALIVWVTVSFIISFFWNQPYIAMVIATSMATALMFSSISAFFITLSIKKGRLDPAIGSGPLTTIVSDVSSILIYFIIVSIFI